MYWKSLPQQLDEKRKRISNWKEVKLSLFADGMILYIENPKDATKETLELIYEFGEVARYKISIQKSVHSYTITMKYQKEKLMKQSYLPVTSKRIKYLGINLSLKRLKTCA